MNQINFRYNVSYAFGDVVNILGCQTEGQAVDMCDAITMLAESSGDEVEYLVIGDTETGEDKIYPVARKINLDEMD
jgi:hypothetical protein